MSRDKSKTIGKSTVKISCMSRLGTRFATLFSSSAVGLKKGRESRESSGRGTLVLVKLTWLTTDDEVEEVGGVSKNALEVNGVIKAITEFKSLFRKLTEKVLLRLASSCM